MKPFSALSRSWWVGGLSVLCLRGALGTVSAESNTGFFQSFLARDLQVLTVTDMTDEGRAVKRATKAEPVYYEALNLGFQNYGRSIAGEKYPDPKQMLKLIMKVLADQGYYPARTGHPPTVYLVFAWGAIYGDPAFATAFMGGDRYDLMWEYEFQVGGALNPNVLRRGMRSAEAQTIMDASGGQIYMASVRAYDEIKVKNGYAALLWHTKISCPAAGLAMDSAISQMVKMAGPSFGRETGLPVFQSAAQLKESFTYGDLQVMDSIDVEKMPVTDVRDWDREESEQKHKRAPSPTPKP